MVLKTRKLVAGLITLFFMAVFFLPASRVFADAMADKCDNVNTEIQMECADTPADCKTENGKTPPPNCLFLEEPIGGDPGYDLYVVTCTKGDPATEGEATETKCDYTLWRGQAITENQRGPVQAILTYEKGKEYQGPFALLYNYVQLIYKFMSGIIVGFVVLMVIIGGIMISTAGGDDAKVTKGKDMIMKSLIGMALWFLASVILYTINPTFFAF
ncbi:hypothetical protein JXA05_01525 [Candidatus Peregrinibacteria bacterium]|nr:hypothetical protein [Candidatus Peregrinibacteria bacterium]